MTTQAWMYIRNVALWIVVATALLCLVAIAPLGAAARGGAPIIDRGEESGVPEPAFIPIVLPEGRSFCDGSVAGNSLSGPCVVKVLDDGEQIQVTVENQPIRAVPLLTACEVVTVLSTPHGNYTAFATLFGSIRAHRFTNVGDASLTADVLRVKVSITQDEDRVVFLFTRMEPDRFETCLIQDMTRIRPSRSIRQPAPATDASK